MTAVLMSFLVEQQFWILELQFLFVLITTIIEAPRVLSGRWCVLSAVALAVFAWGLASTLPVRTSRIYYDEQIYQSIGRSLAETGRAELCNEGDLDSGRLRCARGIYNKQPNGYPYLLSLAYRIGGVSDSVAPRMNNIAAGLAVLVTFTLAALLFRDLRAAFFSGVLLALMPMQIVWANTAAAEPSTSLFSAAGVLGAVHYARVRTATALAWAVALTVFALSFRPESLLVLPLVCLTVALIAPGEFRTRRLWLGATATAIGAMLPFLHYFAVHEMSWGSAGAPIGWRYVAANFRSNFWFYAGDERFPALFALFALAACFTRGAGRQRLLLLVYFLTFWGVFLFFYAGSYDYGADVRYSLLSYIPLAILGGASLARILSFVKQRWFPQNSSGVVLAAAVALILFNFLSFTPLIRATGEEAWAARADVRYAKEFSQLLPANSIVLTHNPSMFHVWGVNAAQLSLAQTESRYLKEQLFSRYSGGVYVHWNFWCNVSDPVQQAFCSDALDSFPHRLIQERREQDYRYALYSLERPIEPRPIGHP
jgi:4-amino-4-deoxy-L-arabinose transferase-like glycosyltransferase